MAQNDVDKYAKELISLPSFVGGGRWDVVQEGNPAGLVFQLARFARMAHSKGGQIDPDAIRELDEHTQEITEGTVTILANVSSERFRQLTERKYIGVDEEFDDGYVHKEFNDALKGQLKEFGNDIEIMFLDSSLVIAGLHKSKVPDFEKKFNVKVEGLPKDKPSGKGRG